MLRTVRQFVLGPWPLRFGTLWTFVSVMVLGTTWRLFGIHPMIEQQDALGSRILGILAVGLFGPGALLVPLIIYWLIRKRVTQRPVKWPEYLLAFAVAAVIGGFGLNSVFRDSGNYQDLLDHPQLFNTASRLFIPFWFINAVIGTVFARIQKESDTAKAALETVVIQRRLLLESEERVRAQVSVYLHDRVQTDLVSIGLRLRAAITKDSDQVVGEIEQAMGELERIRSEEVRTASRQLSPNLARVALDTSLNELADAYRPGMKITVAVSEAALQRLHLGDDITTATALYRICEQGLLNAAIHGHAAQCSIDIALNANDDFELVLHDDGVGLNGSSIEPGMGSTVIAAWVESLNGQWSLSSAPVGMTLTASLPAHSKNVD